MKTAISIPDDEFKRADKLARRLGKSRSELYREAVAEYVARRDPDAAREAMDAVVDQLGESDTGFVSAAARRILRRSQW